MKKTMLPIMFLTFLLLVGVLSGCSFGPKTDGFFEYTTFTDKETGKKCVIIDDLTEEGKQQKVIVIPPYIKGMPVTQIGRESLFGYGGSRMKSDVLEKIFIPETITKTVVLCTEIKNLDTVMFYNSWLTPSGFRYWGDYHVIPSTLVPYLYHKNFPTELENWLKETYVERPGHASFEEYYSRCLHPFEKQARIANIEFLLNYDEGLADIFWIDYEPANSLITKWFEGYYTPKREGYMFAGWYKEPECINEWNFETDRTPAEVIDEETGEPVLQITRLYAKWVEN